MRNIQENRRATIYIEKNDADADIRDLEGKGFFFQGSLSSFFLI